MLILRLMCIIVLFRCPQRWMQTGRCNLPARRWDPLQVRWAAVASPRSWSKCCASSTRRSATWRKRRWGACNDWEPCWNWSLFALSRPGQSASLTLRLFLLYMLYCYCVYYRANWMTIKSGRTRGKVSTRTSWWVPRSLILLYQLFSCLDNNFRFLFVLIIFFPFNVLRRLSPSTKKSQTTWNLPESCIRHLLHWDKM